MHFYSGEIGHRQHRPEQRANVYKEGRRTSSRYFVRNIFCTDDVVPSW
jgi:hypothetical protein